MYVGAASTPPAPVWVPGFWVEPAASRSRSIPVPPPPPPPPPPLSGAAASSSATQAAGVGNVHHVPPLPYVPPLATSYAGRLTSAIFAACNLRLYRRHRSFSTHRRHRGNTSCFGAVTRSSSSGPSGYSGSRGARRSRLSTVAGGRAGGPAARACSTAVGARSSRRYDGG
jgi:hypothetical protein